MNYTTEKYEENGVVTSIFCQRGNDLKIIEHYEKINLKAEIHFMDKHGQADFKLLDKKPYAGQTADEVFACIDRP